MPSRLPALRSALCSALLACVLYAITLGGTFVYDDIVVIREDPRVKTLGGWLGYFKSPYMPSAPDKLWRPLTCGTYWLQYQLHGPVAWPFHLVNILLHAGAAALVAIVAWQLTRRTAVAWLAGLIFAAHPAHVEAVAYLVGRAESLCTLGVLGGIALFLVRPLSPGRVAGIVACFVLASMSKEHGVLLAPMILLIAIARRWLGDAPPLSPQEKEPAKWLFVGLSFGLLGYTLTRERIMNFYWDTWFLRWTINPLVRAHGLDRALLPFSLLGQYVGMLVLPLRPSPDYGANINGYLLRWNDPYLYLGFAIAIVWAAVFVIAIVRKWTTAIILLGCGAIAYALISNTFILIGVVMGERLIYLTSAFVIIGAAVMLARLPRRAVMPIGVILIGLMSLRTVTYAWRWNDALRLFSLSRAEHPQSIYLHVLEAAERLRLGDLDGAERVAAVGRALQPEAQNIWAVSTEIAEARHDPAAGGYAEKARDLENNPPQATKRLSHFSTATQP